MIFCFSGLEEDLVRDLVQKIGEIGAESTKNLATDVTHLVTLKPLSLKYRTCRQLNIPVVLPGYVECLVEYCRAHPSVVSAAKDLDWIIQSDLKLAEQLKAFIMRDLENLLISTSGITQMTPIVDQITRMGGTYDCSLCLKTDLLIVKSRDFQSDKVTAAKKWELGIIDVDTFLSMDGNPDAYTILLSSFPSMADLPSPVDPNLISKTTSKSKSATNILKTKAGVEKMFENVCIYLGNGFDSSLVEHIRKMVRQCGGVLMSTLCSPVTHYISSGPEYHQEDLQVTARFDCHVVNHHWLSDSFVQGSCIDHDKYLVKNTTSKTAPSVPKAQTSVKPASNPPKAKEANEKVVMKQKKSSRESSKVFSNLRYHIQGFSESEASIMEKSIALYGGKVVDRSSKFNYLISPLCPASNLERPLPTTEYELVTEFWLEKCIQEGKLLDSKSCVTFRPLKYKPLPKNYIISTTGFDEMELMWIKRLAQCVDVQVTSSFSKKNDILICKAGNEKSLKAQKAVEWGIRVVDFDWIYSLLDDGNIDFDYSEKENNLTTTSAFPSLASGKGKTESTPAKNLRILPEDITTFISGTVGHDKRADDTNPDKTIREAHDIVADIDFGDLNASIDSKTSLKRYIPIKEHESTLEVLPECYKDNQGILEQKRIFGESPVIKKQRTNDSLFPKKDREVNGNADTTGKGDRDIDISLFAETKVFAFSGLTAAERSSLPDVIQKLGGIVSETNKWDVNTTHLIVSKPKKTEKCLSACAACVWILPTEYIYKSAKQMQWLPESEFCNDQDELISASQHWINIYKKTGHKPFHGWKVYIAVDKSKVNGLQSIVKLGGAEITTDLTLRENFYLFVDANHRNEYSAHKPIDIGYLVDYLLSKGEKRPTSIF